MQSVDMLAATSFEELKWKDMTPGKRIFAKLVHSTCVRDHGKAEEVSLPALSVEGPAAGAGSGGSQQAAIESALLKALRPERDMVHVNMSDKLWELGLE
eukprot:7510996-Karenia_brevis.AAC.1